MFRPVPDVEPTNVEHPARTPRNPMGAVPVIVHLADPHGAACLIPGQANR